MLRILLMMLNDDALKHVFKMCVYPFRPFVWLLSWMSKKLYRVLTGETEKNYALLNSRSVLVKNDYYRDRLREKEIHELLDLSEAFNLSPQQRHNYFKSFLKIDWPRRSFVTTKQLFLYCGIRRTRLADVLLTIDVSGETKRKDSEKNSIVQLLVTLFSICTLNPTQIVDTILLNLDNDPIVSLIERSYGDATPLVLKEKEDTLGEDDMNTDIVIENQQVSGNNGEPCHVITDASSEVYTGLHVVRDVSRILTFSFGVLNNFEKSLKDLLSEFYSPKKEKYARLNLMKVHKIRSLRDILFLFPVLIYPAFWIQKTIRHRVVGENFWNHMRLQRDIFFECGLNDSILSVEKILATAALRNSERAKKTEANEKFGLFTASKQKALKVLPVLNKRKKQAAYQNNDNSSFHHNPEYILTELNSMDDAWRITAGNLLVTIHVSNTISRINDITEKEIMSTIDDITMRMRNSELTSTEIVDIRGSIVKSYGYQFANFILKLSHLSEHAYSAEEKQYMTRYEKALKGEVLSDDMRFWKEMFDEKENEYFYYNVRTGESTWKKPLHFDANPTNKMKKKKKKKKKKVRDD